MRGRLRGRFVLLVAGMGLIVWGGYMLAVRMDDFTAWFSGLRHLSKVRGDSLWENFWIMMEEPAMKNMMLKMAMLLASVVLGLFCLFWSNRYRCAGALILMSVGLGVWMLTQGINPVQIGLLSAVLVGSVLNLTTPKLKPIPIAGQHYFQHHNEQNRLYR